MAENSKQKEINKMKEGYAKMSANLNNLSEDVKRIEAKIDKFIDKEERKERELNSKYAGKWVEKVTIGLLVAVLGGIFVLLVESSIELSYIINLIDKLC